MCDRMPLKCEVRKERMMAETLYKSLKKGYRLGELVEATHKHPTNIMTCFKPKAGIPMLE